MNESPIDRNLRDRVRAELESRQRGKHESAFEYTVIASLVESGWLWEEADESWDVARAIHIDDLTHWLSTHYPDEWEKVVPPASSPEEAHRAINKLLDRLDSLLKSRYSLTKQTREISGGMLGTLKKGFSHVASGTAKFGRLVAVYRENRLYYDATANARSNRLRVMNQVRFDTKSAATIDLVLLVNGIPIATLELKTDNTQSAASAIRQYKKNRIPTASRTLLQTGRALVHFAVSNSEIAMTTRLDGKDTRFLPFNQGNDGGAGNPPSDGGEPTSYLWERVLQPELFLRILRDYALWEPNRAGDGGRLIFPRYHQLRATERVISDMAERGPGGRYLIQHSAGSGKTKTIAWLAHRANRVVGSYGNAIFNSVIVVSDRNALDENIREGLGLLRASDGMVINVTSSEGAKSAQLRDALSTGGHIISTTIQTFPALARIFETDPAMAGRTYCVIIDEAHSSQHGEAAKKLRETLVAADVDEFEGDDAIVELDSAVANSANISFVALTATPKAKTIATYGVTDPARPGERVAFDLYPMSQAIEEGFILDVLPNYSTYEMFAKVRDSMGRTEYVDESEAVADMVRFARLHPTSIAQKVEVVVDHFRRNVQSQLGGTAKAMVVTSDRRSALNWYLAMKKYLAEQGVEDIVPLVAFSGSLDHGGDTVTEASLNGFSDTAGEFRKNDTYRFLIVANKYQTGFDEPRLCAMYVDKKLWGIAAVQTLSRLNRIFPGKPSPMVVDFVNDADTIVKSFKPYYRDAWIQDDVDPNALSDLGQKLDDAQYYFEEDLDQLAELYLENGTHSELTAVIKPVVERWQADLKEAEVRGDREAFAEVRNFRTNCRAYKSAWEFLSQIVDFRDPMAHKRAIMAAFLVQNLKTAPKEAEDYTTGIELAGVEIVEKPNETPMNLAALDVDGELEVPGFDGRPVSVNSPVKAAFNEAVEKVNQILGAAGISASDTTKRAVVLNSYERLAEDPTIRGLAYHNSADALAETAAFKTKGFGAVYQASKETEDVYKAISEKEENLDAMLVAIAGVLTAAPRDEELREKLERRED